MSRKQRPAPAQPTVIDACCLIDLLASGEAGEILHATGRAWHLPAAVQNEVKYVRRHDPDTPGAYRNELADLSPLVNSGVLSLCQPDDPEEEACYVHYATIFRSDGEAMCLALAERRGWTVATDDRKAIKLAQLDGMKVISSPQIIKSWSDAIQPDSTRLRHVLTEIQTLAQFRPTPTLPEFAWWEKAIRAT